ncbi:MAG: FAD-dependent oxidoreductase [Hyphomicrobiales bacterium]|nr:FAD-dependent oxidoreductase [Hyphomicrobiales bacterium]MDE2114486.1 FAD-dependent oxidoreductase [Hyphomicrobiales bacterium]
MSAPQIVIVGAGEAGVHAAVALREAGWQDGISLLSDEGRTPYERPPLSKAVMLEPGEACLPRMGLAARLDVLNIELRNSTRILGIDCTAQTVQCEDGQTLGYHKLLLATGARARRLNGVGGEHALTLRSYEDALAIRAQLKKGQRVVIIGGGFIGLELAASACQLGCIVTVLEAAPRILMRGVPAEIAGEIARTHRARGVDLRTGVTIEALHPLPNDHAIALGDGEFISADCIIAGIGAAPETTVAQLAGLALDNGIAADASLRTSDPHIYAAGDCCSFPHPLYNGRRIRLEAWRNAQAQGTHAAKAMLGASEAYAEIPWFWTDQFDLHLQIAGLCDAGCSTVTRELGEGATLTFHLDATGRLVAATGLGPMPKVGRDVRLAEMMIAKSIKPAPAALASPDTSLKSLLRS